MRMEAEKQINEIPLTLTNPQKINAAPPVCLAVKEGTMHVVTSRKKEDHSRERDNGSVLVFDRVGTLMLL